MAIQYTVDDDIDSIETLTKYTWLNRKPYLDTFKTGKYFVFMTKPELFINPLTPLETEKSSEVLAYSNMCSDAKFSQYLLDECHNKSDALIIKSLSYKYFDDYKSSFIPLITNLCTGIDLPDISIETNAAFTTRRGYNILMPGKTESSRASSTISLRLTETHNLDVSKMIKLWIEYIANITDGTFYANPVMIKNNTLDYMTSLYVFVMDEDGKTIKHYSKYTGLYPTSTAESSLSGTNGDSSNVELNIPFVYTLYESMDPRILEDFNRVALRSITSDGVELTYEQSSDKSNYLPISTSKLLNKHSLLSGQFKAIIEEQDRDPIVYFDRKQISGNGRYVLSFASDVYKPKELKRIFDTVDPDIYEEYKGYYEDV